MLLTILVFAALAVGAVVLKLVAGAAALSRQVPKRNEDFIFY
ncbi:hypothetical protein [Roseateles paludis]|uniref:Uncharacterized protein n=1 Tax=Roseateles paludis TaxID=3145238 RepID=A0ABV0G4P7_9BURK